MAGIRDSQERLFIAFRSGAPGCSRSSTSQNSVAFQPLQEGLDMFRRDQ